jgi:predicted nucleic acid-binding protein
MSPAEGHSPARPLYVAEPPAQYQLRPPVVVDASLLCAVVFDEAERVPAQAQMSGRRLLAPRLIDYELVAVAVKKQRRGLDPELVRRALRDFVDYEIELADPDPVQQMELAVHYGLSGYDAAYLWLAAELRIPLLTFDGRLADAARRHLGSA